MSNKSELQSNNLDLQEVLETINSLPDANTVELITVEDIDAICGSTISYANDTTTF